VIEGPRGTEYHTTIFTAAPGTPTALSTATTPPQNATHSPAPGAGPRISSWPPRHSTSSEGAATRGGGASENPHAGARDFAFIHQRAGHAHDFFSVALQMQGLKLEVAFHPRAQRGQAE
jgi:hypothetical protein